VVYAVADQETPQRHVVQAYCWQNFGRLGTDWFSEGLSEVGAQWQKKGGPHCPVWMADYLQNDASVSTLEILRPFGTRQPPWQIRAQRWGLCFLLANDPKYSGRFRQFSRDQLLGRNPDFARSFPELSGQLDVDYREFLSRLPRNPGSAISKLD
jgi:hypothetical protein